MKLLIFLNYKAYRSISAIVINSQFTPDMNYYKCKAYRTIKASNQHTIYILYKLLQLQGISTN